MKVEIVITGELEENCYIITKNNKTLVIDPGDDYPKIKKKLDNKNVVGVLLTHRHNDHIASLDKLLKDYDVEVLQWSILKEGKQSFNSFDVDVIFTPGHTNDSVTYYFEEENIMFTGDFLFKDSIGRTDLPTGSIIEMANSITKISKYNDDIKVYPGHGDKTTIGIEKKYNYYFQRV